MPTRLTHGLVAVLAAVLALSVGSCATRPSGRARSRPTRDVTFLVTSDCHYDAFENEDRNERNRDTIREMNAIGNVSWPDSLGGGLIRRARGVLVLGDILDDGDRRIGEKNQSAPQYAFYRADFGFDGSDGLLQYPVYECWGNHDGPRAGTERFGFSFQTQLKERNLLRKKKGWLTALSENGLHCSWDWDDVHFLQLGIYAADRQHPQIRYNPDWHDPQGALTFLREDLAKHVGQAHRPVVVTSHCGFDTDWWHPEDWKVVYEALKPYNVILYLYGHTGTGLRQWAPAGEVNRLRCVNTGQTENGFFVVQIVGDRVRLAYRMKHWLTEKPPDGKTKRTWDGTWEWRHLLNEAITAPIEPAQP